VNHSAASWWIRRGHQQPIALPTSGTTRGRQAPQVRRRQLDGPENRLMAATPQTAAVWSLCRRVIRVNRTRSRRPIVGATRGQNRTLGNKNRNNRRALCRIRPVARTTPARWQRMMVGRRTHRIRQMRRILLSREQSPQKVNRLSARHRQLQPRSISAQNLALATAHGRLPILQERMWRVATSLRLQIKQSSRRGCRCCSYLCRSSVL
jgi:hypothetical protein